MNDLVKKGIIYTGLLAIGYQGFKFIGRNIFRDISNDALKRITTDLYDENMWEMVSSIIRSTPQVIVETNLRSQEGKVIHRPLGSPKTFPNWDQLMFNIAQLHTMPTPLETPVNTKVVIGPRCKKPLEIDIPMLIAPMAYGAALSEGAKIALAKGATMAGTAINNGEGPFLKSERKAAKKYILHYNRGTWNKTPEIIKQVDAIEIQFGQGAIGGVGHKLTSNMIDATLRKGYGLGKGQDAVINSRQPEINQPSDLPVLIRRLKDIAGDIPIGVKIAAGKYLERDLELLVAGCVDFIAVEGAECATKGSAPILQDDCGVPAIFAINRAAAFLREKNLHKKISLLALGKIRTPGDVLKALALGADAVYMGSISLFAIAHLQILKTLPYEPVTQLVWYSGKDRHKFNAAVGAKNLHKYLFACNEEIREAVRSMGKRSVADVTKDDLFALDEITSKGLGVPICYEDCRSFNN